MFLLRLRRNISEAGRAILMKVGNSCIVMLGRMLNFGFAFNDTTFSNRVLRIEVFADSLDSNVESTRESLGEQNAVEVKTLHVNSLILSAHSPYFHKLFKNGKTESQTDLTLRINVYEESSLIDVLKFMYKNTLCATTLDDLLGVLIVADKFEVISCMRCCVKLLQSMPMTLESARLYLELPASVQVAKEVQPLIDATKKYIVARYNDFDKIREEAMTLPLSIVEAILGSEGLQVTLEDVVFDFSLKWARIHYPKLEERKEILTKRLAKCMCFPCMTSMKLKEALTCQDISHEKVLDALFLNVDDPEEQYSHASNNQPATNCNFLGRVYKFRPVKVVQFELPQPRCVVYFNLKKEECKNLFPSGRLNSKAFHLDGRWVFLSACCMKEELSSVHHFGLLAHMARESETCKVDYEFAVMKKASKEFQRKFKSDHCATLTYIGIGRRDLLDIPWDKFISNESEYFINGILHLRVELTLNNSHGRFCNRKDWSC